MWMPNQQVVEAVEALGGRVTKADVLARGVAAAGLERELLYLARATGASLQVNDKGELAFDFPDDVSGALRSGNTAAQLQQAWTTASPWLGFAGRVLFGASLLATVAVLYSAVVILLSTSTSDREDRDGNRGSFVSQNNFAMWFGEDLFFWLTPRPYGYSYYGSYYGGGLFNLYGLPVRPPPKMSFFESVFSFVFGDGDPNTELLAKTRWELIGEVIARNGGSVVAEQLAPYLDPPEGAGADDDRRALDKEILSVLLRFKGRPEVTAKGDIVYVFPELQESRAAGELIVGDLSTKEMKARLESMGRRTSAVERAEIVADYRREVEDLRNRRGSSSPNYLPEQELNFSEAEEDQTAACIAYGAFALLATLFFGSQILTGKVLILARVYPIIGLVAQGFPWLLGYTAAFLGIPTWRWLRLGSANEKIQQRNDWRSQQASKLQQPDQTLRDRMENAANWAMNRASFGDSIYDSSQDSSSREAKSTEDDLKAFDSRLQGR